MTKTQSAKRMARLLRASLAERDVPISHAEALELVARQHGARDWNTLSASFADPPAVPADETGIGFSAAIPIMRIFDEDKAREFYLGFLGFTLDWEHRFEENFPLYCQVSRSSVVLHLSEHSGDGTPGHNVYIPMHGIDAFHRELLATGYRFARPGVSNDPWGRGVSVSDPFGNTLRFCEPPADGQGASA